MNEATPKLSAADETFRNVMALYSVLKTPQIEEIRSWKRNRVECVDFICDVEIRVRDANMNGLWDVLIGEAGNVPVFIREELGSAFKAGKLDIDGDYAALYFRTKNRRK
jgi:hypothetical protein